MKLHASHCHSRVTTALLFALGVALAELVRPHLS